MKVYDNYEISCCHRLNKKGRPHPNGPYTETCDDSQAQFWTLYGHIDGEGVEAIGDFATREAAEQVYYRITGLPFTGSYQADARLRVMHTGPKLLEASKSFMDLVRAATEIDAPFIRLDELNTPIALAEEAIAEATGRAA